MPRRGAPTSGQWVGSYRGTGNGTLVVELDDIADTYAGIVTAYNNDRSLPAVIGELSLPKNQRTVSLRIPITPLDRTSGLWLSNAQFAEHYPGASLPLYADATFEIDSKEIEVTFSTGNGAQGTGTLTKSRGDEPSELKALEQVQTWEEFKRYSTALEPHRHLFRGQENNTWKLRTAFHRSGRASLYRFMSQDVTQLHRNLSGLTAHRFNLDNAHDYAAFLAMVQHHGYPTPLLDWTYSPFIAAFFAYRNAPPSAVKDGARVRIFVLDGVSWNTAFERARVLSPAFLHMTVLEPLALNNPRVVPQQAVSVVTNIDDLELYIRHKEREVSKVYLSAIDLPASERATVMRELDLMGINAGSLFPGLDGACQQLKERFFNT
jgi:hypothetical protein